MRMRNWGGGGGERRVTRGNNGQRVRAPGATREKGEGFVGYGHIIGSLRLKLPKVGNLKPASQIDSEPK